MLPPVFSLVIITKPRKIGVEASGVNINKWKQKAISRREEIKALRKRNVELTESRDKWRQKALYYKSRATDLGCGRAGSERLTSGGRPRGHSYSVFLIGLLVMVRVSTGTGLRSCCKIVGILSLYLELNLKVPCHNSVNNWCRKLGLYYLDLDQRQARQEHEKWVVLIDESVSIGQNRLLIIAGVPIDEGAQPLKRSWQLSDLHLFFMAAAKSWKGGDIARAIEKSIEKDRIAYVVADKGNNIISALRSRNIAHVADCTHALAQIVEHIYGRDEEFTAYTACLGLLRKQWIISANAALMPPQQRSKSRFLNLREISDYGMKVLQKAPVLRAEYGQAWGQLEKFVAFGPLIEQMDKISRLSDKVLKYLKNRGMDKVMCHKLIERLMRMKAEGRLKLFCEKLKDYLQYLITMAGEREHLYCCSDVLESWFGKYKSVCSNQPSAGITDSVLAMVVVGKTPEPEMIKSALSQIKMKDLQEWKSENTTETLQAIRNRIFKNGGKKCG